MGKKKFIDKKKSATFTLVYRESADCDDEAVPDRIFTRVDGGVSYVKGFSEEDPRFGQTEEVDDEDENYYESEGEDSRFADVDEYSGDEEATKVVKSTGRGSSHGVKDRGKGEISEDVRRELIELGYPDDGYNYLQHMRKIGVAGALGAYVPSIRAHPDSLRVDVKAYDASKMKVQVVEEESSLASDHTLDRVSTSTRQIRRPLSNGVLDSDIAAALENGDGSQFDSADELDDDFVVRANDGVEDAGPSSEVKLAEVELGKRDDHDEDDASLYKTSQSMPDRTLRILDEQFDLLAMREYDDSDFELDEEDLLAKGQTEISEISSVLTEFLTNPTYFSDRYETPADLSSKLRMPNSLTVSGTTAENIDVVNPARDFDSNSLPSVVKSKVLEYVSSDSEAEIILVESSEEDNKWDCETIVSTLSNLDNHPGKISTPGKNKMKVKDLGNTAGNLIHLGGRQHLPVDYLPAKGVPTKFKGKPKLDPAENAIGKAEKPVKKAGPRAGETTEERKARKASIKDERRHAREAKKAMKLCYRDEAHRAQHGAAVMGPSTIHLP